MEGAGELTFTTASKLRHKARLAGMNPNYWYPVAWEHEVRRGKVRQVKFWGRPIAVFRGKDGTLGALDDRCAHRHIPLSLGHVRDCTLTCLYHGWTYDTDGQLTGMHHDDFGKKLPRVEVRSYPLKVRYGLIWIFPGDPALADQVGTPEIPNAEGPDRWGSISFDYTWQAHHSMVIDNLCNLTHLYVHGKWVPYDETHLDHSDLTDECISLVWRHTLRTGELLYPVYLALFRNEGTERGSDTTMRYDYPYQSALSNGRVRSCNFMLPIDESTTRVFSLQLWQNLALAGKAASAGFMEAAVLPFIKPVTKEIFRQDGATVEAEQTAMTEHFFKPSPEPNHSVRLFDRLTVERWEAWLASQEAGDVTLGAPTSRPKQL